MTDTFPPPDLSQMALDGLVIDQADVDASLTRLRMRGTPAFTGRDMEEIEAHFAKPIGDLTVSQMQTAAAYVYLRRWGRGRGAPPVTWEAAADVLVEIVEETPDPTGSGPSATSPPSATSGG